VGEEVTTQLMLALVMLRLDYCNAVLASVRQSTLEPLQRVQNAAACLVYQLDVRDHVTPSLMVLHWLPIRCRIDFKLCMIMYGIHTLADARRISKTSSIGLRPAAQQHVLACDRLPAASNDATAANQVGRTRLLACRTCCTELTATGHSCCSQPCHVQETTQNALFNTAFSTC